MIVFNLKCADGHVFEEWFRSSGEFEERRSAHEIACPTCGDHHVEKAIMAPRVNGGAKPDPVGCGGACASGACPFAQ